MESPHGPAVSPPDTQAGAGSRITTASEAIQSRHRRALAALAEGLAGVAAEHPDGDLDSLVGFLNGELLPHVRAEERILYPVIDSLLKIHGRATATMRVDHELLADYVRQIEEAVQVMRAAAPDSRSRVRDEIMRLLLQLQSLLRAHVEKEERVYLPLLEQHTSDDVRQRLLQRLHEGADRTGTAHVKAILDLRWTARHRRHALLNEHFDALAPGEAMTVVDDRDPGAICSEFEHCRAGELTWEYLERGPVVWRVHISRL